MDGQEDNRPWDAVLYNHPRWVSIQSTAPPASCGTRGQQTSGRSYTRPSTQASSGTAPPAPRGTGANAQLQPNQLTRGALTNLLDLIHNQVRAEIQAQAGQEATTQVGQPTVMETTGQQATGQAAVMSQAYSTEAGILIWGNWGELGWPRIGGLSSGMAFVYVCMFVSCWGVFMLVGWRGCAVKGLKNLCTCNPQRALLAVHVCSAILSGLISNLKQCLRAHQQGTIVFSE